MTTCIKCREDHEGEHECLEVMTLEELFAVEHAKLKGKVPRVTADVAIGQELDDIGEIYEVYRHGAPDDVFRARIIFAIIEYYAKRPI